VLRLALRHHSLTLACTVHFRLQVRCLS
jgi:hypothetical protein